MLLLWHCCIFAVISIVPVIRSEKKNIPNDLPFGASTSAYQIEGAWNEDGKGESIWDYFFHNGKAKPSIKNGDIACDSYHRYKEDIRLAANLGLTMFRFSISWTRILPNGNPNEINQKGIDHYRDLVDEMLKYNLTPIATLYHWDLPQQLFEKGYDWITPKVIPYLVDYARIVIKSLPNVKIWLTLNEPRLLCRLGYGVGINAPGMSNDGIDDYLCAYTTIKAHAAVYRMYKTEFPDYTAKMSISLDCTWLEPNSDSAEDKEAANRQMQFECGMYFHPIYKGDWPEVVKERVKLRSEMANMTKSRLPQFTREEIKIINGTHDFLGVNHYYTTIVKDTVEAAGSVISYDADVRTEVILDAAIPQGVYNVLKWFEEQYGPNDVIITEIGFGTFDSDNNLNDTVRSDYFSDFLCKIIDAINDGVKIDGIFLWSLMDDIEWSSGDTIRFGLFYVNFDDPARVRTPKESSKFIGKLMERRELQCGEPSRNWLDVPIVTSSKLNKTR